MITVLTGNFGSGKTEIAVNLAVQRQGTLLDLDLVNPYFRSRRAQITVETKGVRVVIPAQDLANTDLPIVAPQVLGELQKANKEVIIDVGGDNVGAIVLGRFSQLLKEKRAQILLVLNPYRPFTGDFAGVKQMIEEIEKASRLEISGIISNPNMGRQTTLVDILEGHKKVKEIANELGKSIELLTCQENFVDEVSKLMKIPVMGINIYMLAPWEL